MERQDENVYPKPEGDNIDHVSIYGPVNHPGHGPGDPPPEGPNREKKEGILELVYGVLFEPVRTFAGMAVNPPVLMALGLVVALNLAEALMGLFTTPLYFRELNLPHIPGFDLARSLLSLVVAGGFVLGIVKLFFMAGLLHLLAELYGGKGNARSVLAAYALAGLPAAFMIPVQLLASLLAPGMAIGVITGLLSFGVYVWSVVLLVIGIREVHGFSTGKAALTVFTPPAAFIVLGIIGLSMLGSIVLRYIPEGIMY